MRSGEKARRKSLPARRPDCLEERADDLVGGAGVGRGLQDDERSRGAGGPRRSGSAPRRTTGPGWPSPQRGRHAHEHQASLGYAGDAWGGEPARLQRGAATSPADARHAVSPACNEATSSRSMSTPTTGSRFGGRAGQRQAHVALPEHDDGRGPGKDGRRRSAVPRISATPRRAPVLAAGSREASAQVSVSPFMTTAQRGARTRCRRSPMLIAAPLRSWPTRATIKTASTSCSRGRASLASNNAERRG